jgi:hypothetical protein
LLYLSVWRIIHSEVKALDKNNFTSLLKNIKQASRRVILLKVHKTQSRQTLGVLK